MSLSWSHYDQKAMMRSDDGASISHRREGPDAACATLLMEHGRHRLTFTIDSADRNRGFMYLGVLAADERTVGWTRPDYAQPPGKHGPTTIGWGFCPLNGHLHATEHPCQWGARRRKVIAGDLAGRAAGAVIILDVDMDRRTLAVTVGDGGTSVDAQVTLPPAVRPWVLLAHAEDSVTLCGYRGPALARSAAAAEEWIRLWLPATLREHERQANAAKDLAAIGRARELISLGRVGLAPEGVFDLLTETFDAARNGTQLLAQLLALEVACPIALRSRRLLLPPGLPPEVAAEPLFVLPCLLPSRGPAAPPPALLTEPRHPFACHLSFHRKALLIATATDDDDGDDGLWSTDDGGGGFGARGDALCAPDGASIAPLPPVLWSVFMCRLLLASEFLATRDSPPPQLASHWALLAFGHEVVEVRMLPADPTRVKVCIWSVAPGPLAMFLATLAAQAATVARVGGAVDDGPSYRLDALLPMLTIKPSSILSGSGADFDVGALMHRLRHHRPVVHPHSGARLARSAFAPWIAPQQHDEYPDVYLSCRAASSDESLAAVLHLRLSRRQVGAGASERSIGVYLDHTAVVITGRRSHSNVIGSTVDADNDAATAMAAASAAGTVAAAAAMAATAAAAAAEALPQLMGLAGATLFVPIVSHAAIEPMRHLDPARGIDWCDLLLLQWSLTFSHLLSPFLTCSHLLSPSLTFSQVRPPLAAVVARP